MMILVHDNPARTHLEHKIAHIVGAIRALPPDRIVLVLAPH
jgi:hypothetical protein